MANHRTARGAWHLRLRARVSDDARGSQIVEFAVSLPLVAVFLIGILDFGQAYGLKQRLSSAAREGARVGSNQPTADLSHPTPVSVQAIARAVGQYMKTVGVPDCGLASGAATAASAGNLRWKFTGTGCANNPILTIDRGFTTTATLSSPYAGGTLMTIENTQVTLQYPYVWRFGNVIKLLVPGASYGTTTVQATATMQNLN